MKASEVLIKAKTLIEDPKNWTQGVSARDEHGNEVFDYHQAACFCSLGALGRIARGANFFASKAYLYRVMGDLVSSFNDNNTHEEVITKWDEAIALAQSEGN